MKEKVVKIGLYVVIFAVLIALGYFGGYCGADWYKQWKRKNIRVIIPVMERPEIRDRSGVLLIGNCSRTKQTEKLRYAALNGKFAAGFLGFTEFYADREIGKSGIEKMIDKKETPGVPVYVSIDTGIQKIVENWMENFVSVGKSNYIYAICINSQGELISAAQRPVLDINNRRQVDRGGMCFFPAVYIFPISDEFMRLLGSSSEALPGEKEKFKFHHKTGVISPEAKGQVRGLNTPADAPEAQKATAFNYLLAYIGVAEQKDIPKLQLFSSGRQPQVVMKDNITLVTISQTGNNIAALGKVQATDGSWLYFLVCIEVADSKIVQIMIDEIKRCENE